MRFIIELPPELEALLLEEAEKAGMTPSEYALQLLIERMDREDQARAART